jgi:hypothetical protein
MGVPLLATSLVGGAVSAVGSYSSAMYQAGVMKQNAAVAQQNAAIAGMQGQQQQYQQGLKTGQEVGQQVAGFSADGINTQSAGAQNVISGTQKAGVQDQSMLRFNTAAQVQNFDTQASQDKAQAAALTAAAPINAFGTILGSASSIGNQYLMYQKFGTPTLKGLGINV